MTPLLHEADAQNSLQGKGWSAAAAFRTAQGNKVNQCSPRNHLFHEFQEIAFAGLLEVEIEVQGGLFCAPYNIAKLVCLQRFNA